MDDFFNDSIPCSSDFASEYNQLMIINSGKVEVLGEYN